jgi:CubicO group peptidase (beta-lactamase class C family)
MRSVFAAICFLSACTAAETQVGQPPVVTQDPAPPMEAPNEIGEAIDELFTEAEATNAFAGSVLVYDSGKRVLEKGYGLLTPKGTEKNLPDSIFRVGSISKQFTAAAVLKLAQQGKLSVTDPVSKYFPEYPKENLSRDGVELTLHHLLAQTSGLPDPVSVPAISKQYWFAPIDPQVQVNAVLQMPLLFKPGSKHVYLNYNYLLLGLVVERVSGEKYEVFLTRELFAPAGMIDTGTALPAEKASRASVGSDLRGGKLTVLTENPQLKDRDVTWAFGSGQIYSTISDLARWDRALASESILGTAQKQMLFTANLSEYGYGWVIESRAGVPIVWHNGALSPLGFSSYMVRVPSKDRFIVYLSNYDIGRIQGFEAKVEAIAIR